jgi:putative endonuclease
VYVLKSEKGLLYIGQTNNIEDRLKRHNHNRSIATKNKGLWSLVYQESFETRSLAMKREKSLKTFSGREWIRQQDWWSNRE